MLHACVRACVRACVCVCVCVCVCACVCLGVNCFSNIIKSKSVNQDLNFYA